jgi:RNA polymerase sigma factor (sigma-70 family)
VTPEEVLNYYFRTEQIIAWLEKDTRQLEADIMELSATVAEERQIGLELVTSRKLVAASGGQPSCGLPKGLDDAYVIYEAQINRIETELLKKRTLLLHKKQQIREMRDQIEPIRRIISELEPDEQEIVEMAYKHGLTNCHIAIELDCDERTIRRKKERIIQKIADKCRESAEFAPRFYVKAVI